MPEPGQVSVLTQSNGRLSNRFNQQAAPYFNSPFYFAKIVNDYNSSFLNPWFGDYGMLVFFGGGHAATNDNSVVGLILGESSRFVRLVDPSPIKGTGTDEATIMANIFENGTAFANDGWGDAVVDQRPISPHSYGSGDILGPGYGGAEHGTFMRVVSGAGGVGGGVAAEAAHRLDFNRLDGEANGPNPGYQWQRVARKSGAAFNMAAFNNIGPPQWSAFVPAQGRVYYATRNSRPQRWFDLTTSSYAEGRGAGLTADADGPDNGILFHVPERELLIFMDRFGGKLRARICPVNNADPSWDNAGVAFSRTLDIDLGWSCACWCTDNGRILVGDVLADNAAVFEIKIPVRLSDPWPVERAPFAAGQRIAFAQSTTYKKWSYNPQLRAIVYMPLASAQASDDTVYVYRPRGT